MSEFTNQEIIKLIEDGILHSGGDKGAIEALNKEINGEKLGWRERQLVKSYKGMVDKAIAKHEEKTLKDEQKAIKNAEKEAEKLEKNGGIEILKMNTDIRDMNELLGNSLKCQIKETAPGAMSYGNNPNQQWRNANIEFYDDKIIINKKGGWTGSDKGKRTIGYGQLTSVDVDNGFAVNHLTLMMTTEPLIITAISKVTSQTIGDFFNEKINGYRDAALKPTQVVQQQSGAAELKEWKELLDSGIITIDEFNKKKSELI